MGGGDRLFSGADLNDTGLADITNIWMAINALFAMESRGNLCDMGNGKA